MTYRDILVQIDAEAGPARYAIAAELASRARGVVTGVYLKTTLINQYNNISAIAYLPPIDLDRMIREHNEGQEAAAARSGAQLTTAAKARDAQCATRVIGGDTPDDLVAETRRADLVILAPPSSAPAYNVHASPVDVCLAGGGPVLVVPDGWAGDRVGARPLVAWNGSREAARALRDALPLFDSGATVEVRIARHKDALTDDAAPIRQHLERHGLRANVVSEVDDGRSIGDWLRSEAKAAGCDMLVMGLYGHARMQEFVLGGVSHDMLHAPGLPLLISH